jgi:hypothetical protein
MRTNHKSVDYVTRNALMQLLSDEEMGRMTTLESGPALAVGDEYVDLEHPHQGIRRVLQMGTVKMSEVLPRRAVGDATWSKICARLAS